MTDFADNVSPRGGITSLLMGYVFTGKRGAPTQLIEAVCHARLEPHSRTQ